MPMLSAVSAVSTSLSMASGANTMSLFARRTYRAFSWTPNSIAALHPPAYPTFRSRAITRTVGYFRSSPGTDPSVDAFDDHERVVRRKIGEDAVNRVARHTVAIEVHESYSDADHPLAQRNNSPTGSASELSHSASLGPGRDGEARRAVRVDVPEALVVFAESGGEHEAGTKFVHARDLVGQGYAVRDPLGEPVHERLDLREQPEHLLVDPAALRIIVAHGGLGNPHGASHVDLFHLVGLEEFASEARADRRQ